MAMNVLLFLANETSPHTREGGGGGGGVGVGVGWETLYCRRFLPRKTFELASPPVIIGDAQSFLLIDWSGRLMKEVYR